MVLDQGSSTRSNVSHLPETQRSVAIDLRRLDEMTAALTKSVHENIYRSHLMAVAGHDLKQPLQVLSMLFERLALQIRDAAFDARLKLAFAAIQQIADGLDHLALSSNLDAQIDLPIYEVFPIADILNSMNARWHQHAERKKIGLRIVSNASRIASNRVMMTTILDNLVGNAIKYTSQGRVLVACRRINDVLSIRVYDTGKGISPEKIEQIFLAFHQEDTDVDGLGLGLSIVQRTAAILGNRVEVKSRIGVGSVFSIDVPLDARTASIVDG